MCVSLNSRSVTSKNHQPPVKNENSYNNNENCKNIDNHEK